ncbi:MAG: GGDEF domain-containing protein [Bosea sp. (in: a-proteobacteria)]
MIQTDRQEPGFDLADEALALMRKHGSPAYPRSFEVWYAHLSGENPALCAAMTAALEQSPEVGVAQIDTLYDRYLGQTKFTTQAERSSAAVIAEINSLMKIINEATGTHKRYGVSLKALSSDLDTEEDHQRVREIIESLVIATKDAATDNSQLEKNLNECRMEIHHLREALESTRADALTDALTGLANRRHFEEMLQKSIDQATLTHEPFALVMCDIEFFKRFNDQHGHMTGDQVLRLVANTIKQKAKTTAIPCRYGGEEFAIILPQADVVAGRVAAETIRQALLTRELVIRSTGESIGRVTISLGVAAYRRGDTAASIIDRSDHCLLRAKRNGRNRTIIEDAAVLPETKVA